MRPAPNKRRPRLLSASHPSLLLCPNPLLLLTKMLPLMTKVNSLCELRVVWRVKLCPLLVIDLLLPCPASALTVLSLSPSVVTPPPVETLDIEDDDKLMPPPPPPPRTSIKRRVPAKASSAKWPQVSTPPSLVSGAAGAGRLAGVAAAAEQK